MRTPRCEKVANEPSCAGPLTIYGRIHERDENVDTRCASYYRWTTEDHLSISDGLLSTLVRHSRQCGRFRAS